MSKQQLRVVTFNILPIAYQLLTRWITETNNKHILAVTTPGPTTRPTPQYKELVTSAPRDIDLLVTTRLRKVATPLIRALNPDLIMCFSFPYRLPLELISIPKIGAVNLHPAPLPAYRGPNVFRMFYEDWHEYGTTIHWMDEEFDTGNILSQARAPMPEKIDLDAIMGNWIAISYESLKEGMAKAIAGEAGLTQDNAHASYAAPYTKEEKWLSWTDTVRGLQLKTLGLQGEAKAQIAGQPYAVTSLVPASENQATDVGTIIEHSDNSFVIQVVDGIIQVEVVALPN